MDAAKSYERFIEEFAADEKYPFEDHEDAPGIPDLRAGLGSVEKLLEGQKRGAPTIPKLTSEPENLPFLGGAPYGIEQIL